MPRGGTRNEMTNTMNNLSTLAIALLGPANTGSTISENVSKHITTCELRAF